MLERLAAADPELGARIVAGRISDSATPAAATVA